MGQSLAAARDANDPMRCALALEQIGRVYLRQGHYTDAREVLTLGALTAERAHSGETTALLLSTQARAYAEVGNAPRAIDTLTCALEAITTRNDTTIPDPRRFNHDLWSSESGRVYAILTAHDASYAAQAIAKLTSYTAQPETITSITAREWARIGQR